MHESTRWNSLGSPPLCMFSSTGYLVWLKSDNDLYNSLAAREHANFVIGGILKTREKYTRRRNKLAGVYVQLDRDSRLVYLPVIYITPITGTRVLHHISNYYMLINDARVVHQWERERERGRENYGNRWLRWLARRRPLRSLSDVARKRTGMRYHVTSRAISWTSLSRMVAYSRAAAKERANERASVQAFSGPDVHPLNDISLTSRAYSTRARNASSSRALGGNKEGAKSSGDPRLDHDRHRENDAQLNRSAVYLCHHLWLNPKRDVSLAHYFKLYIVCWETYVYICLHASNDNKTSDRAPSSKEYSFN